MALAVAAAGALMSATGVVGATSMLASSDRAADGPGTASGLVSDGGSPGTSTSLDPITVTEKRDVFDMVVVPTTPAPPASLVALPLAGTSLLGDEEEGHDGPTEPERTTATTAAPRPASTPTTTTTPASPPMPSGCIDGQLEDDGRWNCQSPEHDDD